MISFLRPPIAVGTWTLWISISPRGASTTAEITCCFHGMSKSSGFSGVSGYLLAIRHPRSFGSPNGEHCSESREMLYANWNGSLGFRARRSFNRSAI